MTQITFTQMRRDTLCAKLTHLMLDVIFDDSGDVLEVYLNDLDYPPDNDSFEHMFLIVEYERYTGMPVYMSITDIVNRAKAIWPDCVRQWDAEQESERQNAEFLASPEKTGRI